MIKIATTASPFSTFLTIVTTTALGKPLLRPAVSVCVSGTVCPTSTTWLTVRPMSPSFFHPEETANSTALESCLTSAREVRLSSQQTSSTLCENVRSLRDIVIDIIAQIKFLLYATKYVASCLSENCNAQL